MCGGGGGEGKRGRGVFRGQHVCLYLCIADGGGGEGGSEPGDSLRFLTVWPSLEGGRERH